MSDFWINTPDQYVALSQESRKYYLHPWLRNFISGLKPKSILDFGSGDGSLFIEFGSEYEQLFLFDHSERMLSLARQNFSHELRVRLSSEPQDVPSETFDVVVCSLVLMTIQSQQELEDACALMFRAAVSGSHCIIAVTHPCFRQYPFSTFSTEFKNRPFEYMNEGIPFRVSLTDAHRKQSVEFTDYHWSMSHTVNLLIRSGFQLLKMVELPDQSAMKHMENKRFPGYLVLDFCKPRR